MILHQKIQNDNPRRKGVEGCFGCDQWRRSWLSDNNPPIPLPEDINVAHSNDPYSHSSLLLVTSRSNSEKKGKRSVTVLLSSYKGK